MKQEYTSANTSINSTKVPSLFKKVAWKRDSSNLDYGGGKYNTATKYLLANYMCLNFIYDPFNRSEAHNELIMSINDYDTATLSNVLNVIKEQEIRIECLKDIKKHLKPNGILYISIYEGNKSGVGKPTKKSCWQNNMRLKSYLPEVKQVFDSVEITRGYIKAM